MDRIDVLLREAVASLLQALPSRAVLLVRDGRSNHPVADRFAVDGLLELSLEGCALLSVLARQLGEIILGREAPELRDAAVAVRRRAERLCLLKRRELRVALVQGLEVERVLVTGVVEVVLLVQLRDEAVDPVAVGVELLARRRGGRHGRRIVACARSPSGVSDARSCWRSRARWRELSTGIPPRHSSSFRTRRRVSRSTNTPIPRSHGTSNAPSSAWSGRGGDGNTSRRVRRTRPRTSGPPS